MARDEAELLADNERLRAQVDRQAASFVEQRGKLYEALNNLAEAKEKVRFYGELVDAYMRENIQRKAREAALVAVARLVAESRAWTTQNAMGHFVSVLVPRYDLIDSEVDDLIEQARALLASTDSERSGGDGA